MAAYIIYYIQPAGYNIHVPNRKLSLQSRRISFCFCFSTRTISSTYPFLRLVVCICMCIIYNNVVDCKFVFLGKSRPAVVVVTARDSMLALVTGRSFPACVYYNAYFTRAVRKSHGILSLNITKFVYTYIYRVAARRESL